MREALASGGGRYPSSVADASLWREGAPACPGAKRPLSSRRMTDDPIRQLLATLTPAPFIWSPKGTVVIMDEHVREAGGDSDAVGAWVEAHGGDIDRTLPVVATKRNVTAIPKPVGKRYYVVPETELA
ncbi:MAG: hypothetical protein QOG94_3759 [Solirubrobacteraceae bacterium]|jgi:hypothetical protein|nr:hypothetical protein [Solirubrobacteraceae bacterium]